MAKALQAKRIENLLEEDQFVDYLSVLKKTFSKEKHLYFLGNFITASLINELRLIDNKWNMPELPSDYFYDEAVKVLQRHTYTGADLPKPGEWYDGDKGVFELVIGFIQGQNSPFKDYEQSIGLEASDSSNDIPSDLICIYMRQFRNPSPIDLVTYGKFRDKVISDYVDIRNYASIATRSRLDSIGRGDYRTFEEAFSDFGREIDGLNRWEKRARAVEAGDAALWDYVGNDHEYDNWLHFGGAQVDILNNYDVKGELTSAFVSFPEKTIRKKIFTKMDYYYKKRRMMIDRQGLYRFAYAKSNKPTDEEMKRMNREQMRGATIGRRKGIGNILKKVLKG